VRALTRRWLENTQGLVEVEEVEKLAELASQVTANHAIVEVGSHTGLSSCWMAAGSRDSGKAVGKMRWSKCPRQ
jgi:predicted O-methyltransferase YrrM